jgi:photosystem II stability/assembly factor-like uncharacterized protein
MKKLVLFLSLISISSILFAQWEILSPYPTSNFLYDVQFVNQDLGWICGEKGTILFTEDGGENWNNQVSPIGQDLYNMFFIDEMHGWIVGDSGTILSTDDGGQNWNKIYTCDTLHLSSVKFMSLQEGWLVGRTSSGNGIILHTEDSGTNWEIQYLDSNNGFNDIFFVSFTLGWVAGSHGIFHTSDGGISWTEQYITSDYLQNPKMSFIDSLNGWVSGVISGKAEATILLHTIDGGESWISDTVPANQSTSHAIDVYFEDDKSGWALCEEGQMGGEGVLLYYTTDGGTNWNNCPYAPSFGFSYATSMCFIDAETGWVIGSAGGITHTNNRTDWNLQSLNTNATSFTAVCFDDQKGFAIGAFFPIFGYCTLYQTNNSGLEWVVMDMLSSGYSVLNKFFKIDANNIWIAGGGVLYQTIDGGLNWERCEAWELRSISDLYFTDIQNGWILDWDYVDDESKIFHTSNGGEDWLEQYSIADEYLKSIYFIDNNLGWTVGRSGDSGVILNTIDGGLTWSNQLYVDNNPFIKVHFHDFNSGHAICYNGSVFKTSNGGDNWIQINEGFEVDFSDVFIVDSMNIWAVGSIGQYPEPVIEGLIYYSKDGGQTWTEQESGVLKGLNGIWFNDINNGWIVGLGGTILRTENGGIGWINDFPSYYSNVKVYPNPSSSSITIELPAQPSKNTSLTISNTNGQQLITQPITESQTEIDISHLTVGIYIVKVWNDREVMVQKVIKQ